MGCFITFEGPDGSGKTTQVQALHKHLALLGLPILAVREPGGTSIGDQIRTILHDTANTSMRPTAEVLLYLASRAQLVDEVIRPALDAGKVVLSDRYNESTLAYQGFGYGFDLQSLRAITDFATGGLRPELVVYLDIAVEEGLRRKKGAQQTGGEWNRMDQKELDFHQRAREGYLQMAANEPERWFVVNAARSISTIQDAIRKRVELLLTERRILSREDAHS